MSTPLVTTQARPRQRGPLGATPDRATWPTAAACRSILSHLAIPLFLAAGMAFAYIGAFHTPTPHNVPIAVVGTSAATKVFAQTLNDDSDGRAAVTTVPNADDARRLLVDQKIMAAYEADATHATLYVATAAGEAARGAATSIFLPIAYQQHLPLQIVDVVPATPDDQGGQTLFFLLVALSVGSYASAVAIAASTALLGIGWRILTAAGTALVLSAIGVFVTGAVYQALSGNDWIIWLLGALYSFGIVTIGVGLHAFLGKWTTPALTLLFVMLNFTSSGGVFPQTLAPSFFAGLNSFWNGAAWLDAARALTYFPGHAIGWDVLRLVLWAAVGVLLVALGHLATQSKRPLADETVAATREEEELTVAAA